MAVPEGWDDLRSLDLVRKCVEELGSGAPPPGDEDDLVETEIVDSMGWVGILTAIEAATGIHDFGNPWPNGRPQTIRALADAIREHSGELTGRSASQRDAGATRHWPNRLPFRLGVRLGFAAPPGSGDRNDVRAGSWHPSRPCGH
jgi:hypothetical protein